MKSCLLYEAEVSAWLDGELDRAEQVELVDHLARCRACREFYLDARALDGAFELLRPSSDAPAPGPEIWSKIERRAERRGLVRDWALRAAAVLVLGVAIAGMLWSTGTRTSEAPRDALIALGEDAGHMTEGRFLELTGEILRAEPRYRTEMFRVMRQVVQETTPSETAIDVEFAGAVRDARDAHRDANNEEPRRSVRELVGREPV